MIYSSSYMYAKEEFGSSVHFFVKQLIFFCLGAGVCFVFAKTKFSFWYKHSLKINFLATLLILLTLIPQFGLVLKGSSRWLRIGFFGLQPGEFAKYTVLLGAVYYFHHFMLWEKKLRIKNLLLLMAPMVLLVFQPDFGMFVLCLLNIVFVCFLSNFPRKWFYSMTAIAGVAAVIIMFIERYRVKRLMSFLDPWNDPQNSGFQVIQSFLAFALGHISGLGLGNSREKLFYLPESYNDFIFSVIGEELGFIGVVFVVGLFLSFIYLGFKLALKIENSTKSLFGVTVILSIAFQAMLNMGVVLGLLPTKGLNLPFISYGGSSLLANACLLGLFFSILKKSNTVSGNEEKRSQPFNHTSRSLSGY